MPDADAFASAHLSRYDALIRISKTLAGHRTMAELFDVLAGSTFTGSSRSTTSALLLHDETTDECASSCSSRWDSCLRSQSTPVADHGPAATVWETQQESRHRHSGGRPVTAGLSFLRTQGRKVACWLPLTTARRRLGVLASAAVRRCRLPTALTAFMGQVAAVVAIAVDNGIN